MPRPPTVYSGAAFIARQDWSRVEMCVAYGIHRYFWFGIACALIAKYVEPISGWLATMAVIAALVMQGRWMKRDDARMDAGLYEVDVSQ